MRGTMRAQRAWPTTSSLPPHREQGRQSSRTPHSIQSPSGWSEGERRSMSKEKVEGGIRASP